MSSTLHVLMLLPQAEGKRGTRDEQLWEDRVIHSLMHSIQITHQFNINTVCDQGILHTQDPE